jgi:hypothetical protein
MTVPAGVRSNVATIFKLFSSVFLLRTAVGSSADTNARGFIVAKSDLG